MKSQSIENLSTSGKEQFENLDSVLQDIVAAVSNDASSELIRKSIETLTEVQRAKFLEFSQEMIGYNENFLALNSKSQEMIKTILDNQKVAAREWREHVQVLNERIDSVSCELHPNAQNIKSTFDFHRQLRATLIQEDSEKRVKWVKRARRSLLESLRFEQMNDRPETIATAHEKTFEWIFEDSSEEKKPWDKFSSWLQHASGLYWVSGKPASGKSTLMKFIWGHRLTKRYLASWARDEQLLTGAFFFWNSGDVAQRSHDGLFRTLLYQVLSKSPELLPKVLPEECERYEECAACDIEINQKTWTSSGQLKKAFENLVLLAASNLRLCFFIDGLDEAEGDSNDIADFIYRMSQVSGNIKFCVSSRLWPVFQEIFDGTPSLRLEDLTKPDILLYVTDKLGTSKNIQKLLRHEPGKSQWLIESIVNRACGVFLWVSVVVKSLISGIRDGDDTEALYRRLCSLPGDLENNYDHIFEQIQREHPIESSMIFQFFQHNGNTLDIFTLFTALKFEDSYERVLSLKLIPMEQLKSKQYAKVLAGNIKNWTRRLNSRCRCLLEVAENTEIDSSDTLPTQGFNQFEPQGFDMFQLEDSFDNHIRKPSSSTPLRRLPKYPRSLDSTESGDLFKVPIRYLHRTARDYVEQPRVWQKLLDKTAATSFDPTTALLTSCLVSIKTSSTIVEGVDQFTEYIVGLGLKASQTNINLLDELDRAFAARRMEETLPPKSSVASGNTLLFSNNQSHIWHGDMLSCALQKKLSWYAEAKGTSGGCGYYTGDQRGLPLVFASLQQRFNVPILALGLSFQEWRTWLLANDDRVQLANAWPQSLSLVLASLASGCNPSQAEILGASIWEYVIHLIHVLNFLDEQYVPFAKWVPIFELMLDHGANPYACCIRDSTTFMKSVGVDSSDRTIPREISEHTKENYFSMYGSSVRRGHAEDQWDLDDTHAYFHSVEAVVRDVFIAREIPGATRLLANILDKKKSKENVGHEAKYSDDDHEGKPHYPRWVA